ncbi:MAG: hypothetical protein P9L93_05435 [Candidatus Gorgyraea atricola]|nr:hypothetical protein [Candidatus Gorgyraea atricola]
MRKIREKIKKNYSQMKRRLTWILYRKKRILAMDCRELIEKKRKDGPIKLHLCCGGNKYQGYINVDIVPLEGTDALMNIPQDLFLVSPNSASEILIESGFEHFYRYQQDDFLKECYRILVDKGRLAMKNIPDFDLIADAYLGKKQGNISPIFDLYEVYRLTHGAPEPRNSPHQLHKDIFTKGSVRELLERNKFKIQEMRDTIFRGENTAASFDVVAVK